MSLDNIQKKATWAHAVVQKYQQKESIWGKGKNEEQFLFKAITVNTKIVFYNNMTIYVEDFKWQIFCYRLFIPEYAPSNSHLVVRLLNYLASQ